MARVDYAVDAALSRAVRVVIDMHHYRQLDGDALDSEKTAESDGCELEPVAGAGAGGGACVRAVDPARYVVIARFDRGAWHDVGVLGVCGGLRHG